MPGNHTLKFSDIYRKILTEKQSFSSAIQVLQSISFKLHATPDLMIKKNIIVRIMSFHNLRSI